MANFLAASVGTAFDLPLRVLRGLADLPAAMDRNMRQTNQLMRESHEQLAATHAELVRMNEQLTRLIRLGEPIERAQRRGERFGSLFRRSQREDAERRPPGGEDTVTES